MDLSRIISEIDAQIAKLQQARELLGSRVPENSERPAAKRQNNPAKRVAKYAKKRAYKTAKKAAQRANSPSSGTEDGGYGFRQE